MIFKGIRLVPFMKYILHSPNLFASTGLDGVLTVWNLLNDDKELRVRRRGLSGVDGPQEAPSPRYDPVKKWGKGGFVSTYSIFH